MAFAAAAASALKKVASSGVGSGLIAEGKELFSKHKNEFKKIVSGATNAANRKLTNKIVGLENIIKRKISGNNHNPNNRNPNNRNRNPNKRNNRYNPLPVGNARATNPTAFGNSPM